MTAYLIPALLLAVSALALGRRVDVYDRRQKATILSRARTRG